MITVSDFGNNFSPDYESLIEVSNEVVKEKDLISKNDILFVRSNGNKGLVGRCMLVDNVDKPTTYSGFCIKCHFDNENVSDPKYFTYYFKNQYFRKCISNASGGTNIQNLNQEILSKHKVRIPPLSTQQKIASILSAYDNLIQNYKKQIEALQTAASELYKEWFVRFRFPGYQTTRFENGIPEEWKVERLSNYCKITDGTHDTPLQVEEGIPLVTGKAVKKGEIDFSIPYNISIEDHEKIKKRSGLKTGDILFSNIGTVGNSCLVEYDREFSVKNMIIFEPETIEKSMYLYYLIISDTCQQLFSAQTNGSTQQFLGLDFMRNFKILVPENSIISEFGKKQEVIYAKIKNLRKQITNLTQQRDLLLPRLMSGRIEIY